MMGKTGLINMQREWSEQDHYEHIHRICSSEFIYDTRKDGTTWFSARFGVQLLWIHVEFARIRSENCMGYLSIRQTAEKWNLSARWISDLCKAGRIPGATKIGSYWAIPADAEKPADARIKSGRYVKTKENQERGRTNGCNQWFN